MKWAFWRKDAEPAARASGRRPAAADDADPGRADPAQALRVRARRRLVGAAALLLAAVIVVPMVLDPAPRPVPDTVPIDIPSDKTPFTPRLPLPPVPDPAPLPGPAEAADGKGEAAKSAAAEAKAGPGEKGADKAADKSTSKAGEKVAEKGGDKAPEKSAAKSAPEKAPADKSDKSSDKSADAQRARDLLEGKTAVKGEGRFFVQAAAPRSEQAARDLAARLKSAGLPSFTERVQASDGTRHRVRVGPFVSRAEAERARAKLRELGLGGDIIAP